jgi:hypothetical protein
VEPFWGNFDLYISKKEEFLTPDTAEYHKQFHSNKNGMYNNTKSIDLEKELKDYYV